MAPSSDNTEPSKPDEEARAAPAASRGAASAPAGKERLGLRWAAGLAALLGYAALSQYSATPSNPYAKAIGAALSIAPVLLAAVVMLWIWNRRWAALVLAAVATALMYRNWPIIERNFEWLDLVEQCGIYGLVAVVFVRSLLANRVPICTQLANQMYGTLSAVEIGYTRRATAAWAMFYALLTLAILTLFFTLPQTAWYLFVNFATWGLMLIAGVADHSIRRRLLPRHEQGGILAVIRRSLIG